MTRSSSFFFGAAIAASSFLVIACGGSTGAGGGGSTSTGSGGQTGTTSTTDTGTTSDTGTTTTSSSATAPTLDCASYCAEVSANCTGTTAQYTDTASCMGTCAAFAPGALGDTSGNTLGCRIYHGGAAKADPATHCGHAGPTGGDKDVADTNGGPCGEGCDAFCDLAVKACAGQAGAYADKPACMTDCKSFKADAADYSTADTSKNDFGCRMYHLTVAAKDATSAATHCAHIQSASPVCTQ